MTPEEFVNCCAREKDDLLSTYIDPTSESMVTKKIATLGLNAHQIETLNNILDTALTDAFYTLLLALDGAASIGGEQQLYKLFDKDGHELTGALEPLAYERFHNVT
ncbi:MAG: hypothetical protein P4L53_13935 [Candidatus Obscuribacterales bacterium]|nr:hypothetical protein [Candidatus Obscuribacterales bacterium]